MTAIDDLNKAIALDLANVEMNPEDIANPREIYKDEPWTPFIDNQELIWASAFRQYNPMESLFRFTMLNTPFGRFEDEENYDPFLDENLKNEVGEANMWKFKDSGSSSETRYRIANFLQDMEDMQVLQNSNSGFESVVAALASPTTFAPLAPLRVLKQPAPLQRFLKTGAFSAVVMAPEELLMASQIHDRDLAITGLTLAGAFIIGGTLGAVAGGASLKKLTQDEFFISGQLPPRPGVGASANPEAYRRTMYQSMEAEALETTGIGIEKLGWNPVIRMLKSPNPFIRAIAPQLVSVGGMIQKKVAMGREMSQSVEDTFSTTYVSELVNSMRAMDTEYLAYRGITASKSDVKRSAQLFGLKAKDLVNRNRSYLTETDFRTRVSRAMRNGDVDDINDLATPKVNAAAHKARKLLNIIKKNAEDVDLFGKAIGKKIKALKTKLSKATSQATIAKIEREIMEAQQELQTLRTTGATPNTAISYLPRIWRVDKLMDNQEHFMKVVSRWAMSANSLDQTAAQNFAREMFDTVTRSRPYMMLDEVSDEIDFITQASGSKLRNFKIPDKLIEEFLENDIEVLLRHHTRTMGMDIELTRRFGDISMEDNIKFIVDDYKKLIKETSDPIKRRSLKESMESDIKDLRGLRDRIRGTYGASKDPHRLSSRFVRGMKSFNVIVGMGGAVLSSIPDVARSIMVEGMDNFYRHGLTDLFNTLPQRLANMKRRELDAATVSADAQLGLRAMSMNDVGDTFGSRFTWERKLNQSTGVFFMLNGLNWWNQTLKEFSGGIIMFRMTDSIMSPWNSLSKTDKRKLLASGISEQDAGRMKALIRQHGHQESGKWYPNTDFWNAVGDDYLVRKFRNALHGSVNRTIVTPGAGDRALWTSTEMGSLMTQFKGYGQAAMVRVLTSGLQEKDSAFWQGAIIMVTMGALVNELKKIQYGIEGEESYDEKLINAIDRSGILGWFTDVNNSLEKISDYKFGARPMFTDEGPMPIPASAKLGAIFGPASSNLATGGSVMSSILRSEFDQNSADSLRFITPGGNLPYLDPIYDGVFNQ